MNCGTSGTGERVEKAGRIGRAGTGETSGTSRTGREFWIGHKLQACASGGISSEWLISFKISSIIQKIDVILSLQSIGVVFIFFCNYKYTNLLLYFFIFLTFQLASWIIIVKHIMTIKDEIPNKIKHFY